MKSKGYLRLYNRLLNFQSSLELAEIVILNREKFAGTAYIFSEVSPDKHPKIAGYTNTISNRKLAVNHLQNTLFVAYIKDIYEEVTEYLRYVLLQGAKNGANINRLVGPHKVSLDANFLLSADSLDLIARTVTDSIFQQLENERSSLELIKKISNKLDLQLTDDIINAALPYLMIRHYFVHEDGKPPADFKKQYPFIRLGSKKRIQLSYKFLMGAKTKVLELITEIDQKVLARGFFPSEEIQP